MTNAQVWALIVMAFIAVEDAIQVWRSKSKPQRQLTDGGPR